jgi:hypothetical protein
VSHSHLVVLDGVGTEPEVSDGVDPHDELFEEALDQAVEKVPGRLATHSHRAQSEKMKTMDLKAGANPTIVSYNATSSLIHFENKNNCFYFYF